MGGYWDTGRAKERDETEQHGEQRDDVGQDRPLDEELGEHAEASA